MFARRILKNITFLAYVLFHLLSFEKCGILALVAVDACKRKLTVSDIKEMFKVFDKDGDNSITKDEMSKVLKNMGFQMSNKEIRTALKQIDSNGKGT